MAARVDAPERLEVERDVHRQPVVAAGAAHAHADTGELAASDIDPRGTAAAGSGDAALRGELDHGTLEGRDEVVDRQPQALQIDERVDHQLSRPVIGHLAAAVDLHHRDVPGGQQVRTV